MRNIISRNLTQRRLQKGAITMFSAVLILILLTSMVIYAVQVGVFEQRKSANERFQKQAFHTADSGIQAAIQFMSAHATLASSYIENQRADGTDGWLADTAEKRWLPCSAVANTNVAGFKGEHPCFGEPVLELRAKSYYYFHNDSFDLPLDSDRLTSSANEQVTTHAVLCMLDIDRLRDPAVSGCTTTTPVDKRRPQAGEQDRRYFIITLLSRGEADCENDGSNCQAEALIAEKIGSYGPGGNGGGSGAPLTARTNVPLSGTVEIVPNPNGGGIGVPISSWVNARTAANDPDNCRLSDDPISPNSGSYATCEAHEFYGQGDQPVDYKCPSNMCSCNKSEDRLLTYASGQDREMGIDIVPDPEFPCDLWHYSFGKTWEEVRELVQGIPGHYLEDCSGLDDSSDGIYWVSGNTCALKDQIGGPDNPVLLISATADTRVSAGAEVFGTLFVTNKEVPGAEFTGNGHATVYGSAIMDATMEHFNGTFQIVWVEDLINIPLDLGLFGAITGGWTDFHASWR